MGNLYQVSLPTQLVGGVSAFGPNLTRAAGSGAVQYKADMVGQPGTQAIAAPTRNTSPSPDIGDVVLGGQHRSTDAPDAWYPQLYYQRSLDNGGATGPVVPARIFSDNMLPVPAVDPRGLPALMAFTPHFLGQQQIQQPRNLPNWGNRA